MEGDRREGQQRGSAVFVLARLNFTYPLQLCEIKRSIDKVENGHVHCFKLTIGAGIPTYCAIDLAPPPVLAENGRRHVDG